MKIHHLVDLLHAAHTIVHHADPDEGIDDVLERIVGVIVDAAAGRVGSIGLEVINRKGRVAYFARAGHIPAGLEPSSAMSIVAEPVGLDTMTICWTVVDAAETVEATDRSAIAAEDVMAALDHMTVVVALAVDLLSLRAALPHRDELATAKGMLMQRNHIDAQAAFALLARYSQDTNTKASMVARRVIDAR